MTGTLGSTNALAIRKLAYCTGSAGTVSLPYDLVLDRQGSSTQSSANREVIISSNPCKEGYTVHP